MIVYPAIDLKDGACVRLTHGAFDSAVVYETDPARQAARFREAGFRRLHVVDLDGALAGESCNGEAVDGILDATDSKVQTGGGVRTHAQIEAWLRKGVDRVVIGSKAAEDPTFAEEAARLFPGRVVVALDARAGVVTKKAWTESAGHRAVDMAKRFEDAGVAAFLYTDVDRDGALAGPNLEATAALADAVRVPVLASGGVAAMSDLDALSELPIEGAVVGKAFYEKRIDLAAVAARYGG